MESPSNFLKSLRWKPSTAINRSEEHVGSRWERDTVIRWYMTRKVCSYCSILIANNSAWSPSLFIPNKCYTAGSIKVSFQRTLEYTPITRRQTPLLDGVFQSKAHLPFLDV